MIPGTSGCFLENLAWRSETIKTKGGHEIPISLLVGFDVRAHVDCGSGEGRTWSHMAKGENITVTCGARASAYDTDELR